MPQTVGEMALDVPFEYALPPPALYGMTLVESDASRLGAGNVGSTLTILTERGVALRSVILGETAVSPVGLLEEAPGPGVISSLSLGSKLSKSNST